MIIDKSDILVFIRFVLVGILNTLFGMSVYFILLYVGLENTMSLVLSTVIGVLFNFKTIGKLVFKNEDNRLLIKFVLCYAFTFVVNLCLIHALPVLTHLNDYYVGAIVFPFTSLLSFLIQKKYVYKKD